MERGTLLERVGGPDTIRRIFSRMYTRAFGDRELLAFFAGVDVDALIEQQVAFLARAWDHGDLEAEQRSMRVAHAHLSIEQRHHDRILGYVELAMADVRIEPTVAAEVMAYLHGLAPYIVNRPAAFPGESAS